MIQNIFSHMGKIGYTLQVLAKFIDLENKAIYLLQCCNKGYSSSNDSYCTAKLCHQNCMDTIMV